MYIWNSYLKNPIYLFIWFWKVCPFFAFGQSLLFSWEAYVDWALPSVRAPCSSSTWSPPAPRRAWGGWRASLLWWPRLSSSAATLRTPIVAAVGGCSRWLRSSFLRWCRFLQVPNLPAFDVGLGLLPFELLYYYLSDHVLGLFPWKLFLSELSYHYD